MTGTDDKEFGLDVVWQNVTPELAEEVIVFWLRERALPSAQPATRRVQQVWWSAEKTRQGISSLCAPR